MFDVDKILNALQNDPKTQRNAAAAGAGALALGLLSGKKGRKMMGKAAKYGAVAAIGGLAYKAWQNREGLSGTLAQAGQRAGLGGAGDYEAAPSDTPFALPGPEAEADRVGKAIIRAMIAAAKADGKIDPDEKQRIFDTLNALELDSEAKAFVFDELSAPLDLDAVVASADTPEVAAEIYAASLVAIEDDTPAEQAYLQMLAARLSLDPALVDQIHQAARAEL